MSTTQRLSSARRSGDPTRSKTLRRRYAQRLRGQFANLNTAIRSGIKDRDALSLNQEEPQPMPVFRFRNDSEKIDEFMRWFRQQQERGVLEVISRDNNEFVRNGYTKGVRFSSGKLQQIGVDVPEQDLEAVLNKPIHRDKLQQLYTRNFEELRGITAEMNQQISRTLADNFAQGAGPSKIADDITDRVDKVGKHRATLMARTEVINAHTEGTLTRFEELGVDTVTVQAEFRTAGDKRVCPRCQALEGNVYTVQEVREETFSFDGTDFPVKPPIHPQCRCVLLPVGGS